MKTNNISKFKDKKITFINESTIFIGDNVEIEDDVIIYPNVTIFNNVKIKSGTIIQPCTTIFNNITINNQCLIGSNTVIRENVTIGIRSIVGPHCEIVRSNIGANCVIAHKNFIGDSIIFDNVKFGCGAIVANTNFNERFKTIVEEGAKIGVNANLIAPIRIGKNSFVAAGSTITNDVPEDNLSIARNQQTNKPLKK